MQVYELIQELTRFKPDTEVEFYVKGKIDVDTEAEFDRENENDVQDVTVTAEIDDYFSFDDIDDNENRTYKKNIEINLSY